MRTIRLATAYQLVLTSLLLGAFLGTVSQRIPETFIVPVQSVQAKAIAEDRAMSAIAIQAAHALLPAKQTLDMVTGVALRKKLSDATANSTQMVIQPTIAQSHIAPTGAYPFRLTEQRQHGEQVVPRLYLYVHNQEEGLGNFTVRVQKDGVTLPVETKTYAGTPGYTWPTAHVRQHLTNLKLEFPDVQAAGTWEIQLVDSAGNAVGPVAHFAIAPNDLNQEMYVRYEVQ